MFSLQNLYSLYLSLYNNLKKFQIQNQSSFTPKTLSRADDLRGFVVLLLEEDDEQPLKMYGAAATHVFCETIELDN